MQRVNMYKGKVKSIDGNRIYFTDGSTHVINGSGDINVGDIIAIDYRGSLYKMTKPT